LADERYLQRFQDEALTAAWMRRTNIVPVFGVDHAEEWSFRTTQRVQRKGAELVINDLQPIRTDIHR